MFDVKLARIHAHLCGDGCVLVYKTSEKDHKIRKEVRYTNLNTQLLEEFRKDMRAVFGVKMSLKPNHDLLVKSCRIVDALAPFGPYSSRTWRIPPIIRKASDEVRFAWITAFLKDEAYVEDRYNRIKVKSVNFAGLMDAEDLLDSLGVFANVTGPNCDGSWYLTIPRKNSTRFKDFTKVKIRK